MVEFNLFVKCQLDCGCPSDAEDHLLHRNVQWFRGGLVLKAHTLCVSLNSGLDSDKERRAEDDRGRGLAVGALVVGGLDIGVCVLCFVLRAEP